MSLFFWRAAVRFLSFPHFGTGYVFVWFEVLHPSQQLWSCWDSTGYSHMGKKKVCKNIDTSIPYKRVCYWPEVIKLFQCSTQLSTKFILLINVKMTTIVGILTFISMINTTSEILKARNFFICQYFSFYEQLKFHEKSFITSGPELYFLETFLMSAHNIHLDWEKIK